MSKFPNKETLLEVYEWRMQTSANDVAFKMNDNEMTYKEYDRQANIIANGIFNEGCEANSRVAVLAKNSVDYAEIQYGSIKSRTVLVGLNWRLAPPEVVFVVNDSDSELLFVGPDFYPLIESIQDQFKNVKKIIAMGEHDTWESFDSWKSNFDDSDPKLKGTSDDDVIQLYTSGTTGLPKGARLTNKNILASTPMVEETWGMDWNEKSVNFVLSPLFHIAGSNIIIMGIVFGCKNIVIPEPDPTRILELIDTEKIETAFMVPALIQFLLNHPNCGNTDFSSLRQIVYGASPISEDTLLKAMDVMDCEFWQVYGLTETSGIGTTLSPEFHDPSKGKLRSCGQAYTGVDIRIIDSEGSECKQGDVGEIQIKSDVILKGYWKRDEANAESIVDDWFYTGDAGFFDEDGFLYIHDRVKDMIISGGENIYPAEVENALMSHPDIIDAAVVGIPDDKWGETVMAFVTLRNDAQETASDLLSKIDEYMNEGLDFVNELSNKGSELANYIESEIITYSKKQIASYKCPTAIEFIKDIPRNPSGKILRRVLREPFWNEKGRNVS